LKFKGMVRGTLGMALVGGLALTGCGSSGNSGASSAGGTAAGALAAGGATDIYVIQSGASGSTILNFSADSSANATPKGTLVLPDVFAPSCVTTDSAGQIYVGGVVSNNNGITLTGEILVYAAGATGSATPERMIFPQSGTESIIFPYQIAVDGAGVIYAAQPTGGIAVIAAGANGATSLERLIVSDQLALPVGIGVDSAGEVFVSVEMGAGPNDGYIGGSILVFAAGANGTVAPARVISAPAPTATVDNAFLGLAVDGAGKVTTVFDTETYDSAHNPTGTSAVVEAFAAGASGAATPTKTISGTATALLFGGGLSVDGVGNVYLVNAIGTTTSAATYSVLGFGPNATGNVTPGLNLASSSWTNAGLDIGVH
jgi:hypothetical protein